MFFSFFLFRAYTLALISHTSFSLLFAGLFLQQFYFFVCLFQEFAFVVFFISPCLTHHPYLPFHGHFFRASLFHFLLLVFFSGFRHYRTFTLPRLCLVFVNLTILCCAFSSACPFIRVQALYSQFSLSLVRIIILISQYFFIYFAQIFYCSWSCVRTQVAHRFILPLSQLTHSFPFLGFCFLISQNLVN